MDEIEKMLLEKVAELHTLPDGAYNIRRDGEGGGRRSTENIRIENRKDGKSGIDIFVSSNTKGESLHIPVVITKGDYRETVYNDFYIEGGADVLIIAGCGIHSCKKGMSEHSGVHTFHIGKGARVRYVERHYGEKEEGESTNVMNPSTLFYLDENARFEMETTQIKGIDSTIRSTEGELKAGAELVIREKIYTHKEQYAETRFSVDLNGDGASADVVSRSVASENSSQKFYSNINGNAACKGHTECDAIIMDKGKVTAVPSLSANSIEAELIHEAAIGKIAGEQLVKLMTLGLDEKQAEEQIIKGFLS